jgi:hypothetical protein
MFHRCLHPRTIDHDMALLEHELSRPTPMHCIHTFTDHRTAPDKKSSIPNVSERTTFAGVGKQNPLMLRCRVEQSRSSSWSAQQMFRSGFMTKRCCRICGTTSWPANVVAERAKWWS